MTHPTHPPQTHPWRASPHGGPDAGPAIVWDFSTNANTLPLPESCLSLLLDADRTRYPDPGYGEVRARLAQACDTEPHRILPTSGSSEGIRRLTLAASLQGAREAWVPTPAYGDYAAAASALRLRVRHVDLNDDGAMGDVEAALSESCLQGPVLLWLCEPCNPTGATLSAPWWSMLMAMARRQPNLILAVDRAYAPLRLSGQDAFDARELADLAWQCWSPNKALGLTGVRAGWIQAPRVDPLQLVGELERLAPSWVLSAEGVSMLTHWHDAAVQNWLAHSRTTLARWCDAQQAGLMSMGWTVQATQVPFFLARPPLHDADDVPSLLARLRHHGIKLRDATSFGLPGVVRLRVHEPAAQEALFHALNAVSALSVPSALRGGAA
jgi:histidinol-phosphate aminotransferase